MFSVFKSHPNYKTAAIWTVLIMVLACLMALAMTVLSMAHLKEDGINPMAYRLGKGLLILPDKVTLDDFFHHKRLNATLPERYAELLQHHDSPSAFDHVMLQLIGQVKVGGERYWLAGEHGLGREKEKHSDHQDGLLVSSQSFKQLGFLPGQVVSVKKQHRAQTIHVGGLLPFSPEHQGISFAAPLDWSQGLLNQKGKIHAIWICGCWCSMDVQGVTQKVEALLPGTRAYSIQNMLQQQKEKVAGLKRLVKPLLGVVFLTFVLVVGWFTFYVWKTRFDHKPNEKGQSERRLSVFTKILLVGTCVGLLSTVLGIFSGEYMTNWVGNNLQLSNLNPSGQVTLLLLFAFMTSLIGSLGGIFWILRTEYYPEDQPKTI